MAVSPRGSLADAGVRGAGQCGMEAAEMTIVLLCVLAALCLTGVQLAPGRGRVVVVAGGAVAGMLVLRGALAALLIDIGPAEAGPLGGSGMMLLTFLAWWTAPNDTTML